MLEAAIVGHGIALVLKVIAHDSIARGQLVCLSDIEVPFDDAYYFVTPPTRAKAIAAFGTGLDNRLRQDFP